MGHGFRAISTFQDFNFCDRIITLLTVYIIIKLICNPQHEITTISLYYYCLLFLGPLKAICIAQSPFILFGIHMLYLPNIIAFHTTMNFCHITLPSFHRYVRNNVVSATKNWLLINKSFNIL